MRFLPLSSVSFTAVAAAAASFLGLFSIGCVAPVGVTSPSAPSKPAVVFPSRAELAALPSQPLRPEALGTSDIAADSWTVDGAPPPPVADYDDASALGAFAREIQQAHPANVALSMPLRCASRELARFYLKHHGIANDSLRRFIVGRCGGHSPQIAPLAWSISVPASVSDAEVVAHGRARLEQALGKELARGDQELGMALVRDSGTAVVVAIVAAKHVALEPGPRTVDANRRLTIRGVAEKDVNAVLALANRGDFAVAPCVGNPNVALPRFELTCELAEKDAWAWVEVVTQKKGQILEEPVADLLMSEGDSAAVTYTARSLGAPALVKSPSEFTSALLARLNALRSVAKLGPLALAQKQSDENARLAGTIFEASLDGDGATMDRAAIGLLAGWNVEGGMIRNGHFYLGAVAPTRDATAWLDAAIERPIGRVTLLDPDVRQVAIGPAIPDAAPGLGAAVTTYALFDPAADHVAEERQFFQALALARKARGVRAPERVGGLEEARAQSAQVLLGAKAPMAALNDLLQVAVERTGAAVRGYVFETVDPTRIEFPADLLRAGPLDVIVVVTHHRAPDAAWGQYVIFALVVDEARTVTASVAPLKRGDVANRESGVGRLE